MSLIEIVDKDQLKKIENNIKKDCVEFSQLSDGSKAKAADQLYTENRLYKELSVAAVVTIDKMDEEIELKGNKINILEKELKDIKHYDEQKINSLLNKNPVIRYNNKERAKRRLMETLSLTYK
jgi:hypothetical protein